MVTITLNPAIDETVFLDRLVPGTVHRAKSHHRQAGGKGVNVSCMLGGFGIPTIATGFMGRENAALFEELFKKRLTQDEFIRIDGKNRTGIKIVELTKRETTDINFPGACLTMVDIAALHAKIEQLMQPGRWFVLAGSLPAGFSIKHYSDLLGLLKNGGAKIAVDTSGAPLQMAIDFGVDLVKPNHHELAEILGHPLPDLASRVAAARHLQLEKVPHVILSLGSEGALMVSPEGCLLVQAPPVHVVSTVGAGDSLLAGYLAGMVKSLPAAERAGLASVFAWSALEDVNRNPPMPAEAEVRMRQIKISLM